MTEVRKRQNRRVSPRGRKFIKKWESDRHSGEPSLIAYDDVGKPAAGWGHNLTDADVQFAVGDAVTLEQAQEWFDADIAVAEKVLHDNITEPLSQNQFDSLASMILNIGGTAFAVDSNGDRAGATPSKVMKAVNEGRFDDVPDLMKEWRTVKGVINNGLVDRRDAETKVWIQSDTPVTEMKLNSIMEDYIR